MEHVGTQLNTSTQWGKKKVGGLFVEEWEIVSGWVPIPDAKPSDSGPTGSGFDAFSLKERWYSGREVRRTFYEYGEPLYPTALSTRQTSVVQSYVPELDQVVETERTTVTQTWHSKGWLRRKDTVKRSLTEIHKDTDPDTSEVKTTRRERDRNRARGMAADWRRVVEAQHHPHRLTPGRRCLPMGR